MKKLTRYSNFEALKSAAKSSETVSTEVNNQSFELESFLNLLRRKLSVKNKNKNKILNEK